MLIGLSLFLTNSVLYQQLKSFYSVAFDEN